MATTQVKQREYLLTVDEFSNPQVVEGKSAVALLLSRLILLEPGSDPLHPDMGVGIRNYRYGINTLSDLENRIRDQIKTYLPTSQLDEVAIIRTPDKVLNIEIRIGESIYNFNSGDTNNPISLADLY
jgi:hypothetical protein